MMVSLGAPQRLCERKELKMTAGIFLANLAFTNPRKTDYPLLITKQTRASK